MKELRFRSILVIAAVALSVYLLYPTFQDYNNNKEIAKTVNNLKDSIKTSNSNLSDEQIQNILEYKEDSIRVADPDIKAAREKRIKLGLDLQGGMYLVMEVNTAKLLERLAKDPDLQFQNILKETTEIAKTSDQDFVSILSGKLAENNIRLSRYFGSIRQEDSEIIDELTEQESDAVTRAIEIIRNRIDQYGVSEPSIQKQGARRIIVELPGVAKKEEAKNLLQGRAMLEFKLVKDAEFTFPIMNKIDEVLANLNKDTTEVAIEDSLLSDTELSAEESAKKHPFFSVARLISQNSADAIVEEGKKDLLNNLLNRAEVRKVIPDNVEFVYSAKPYAVQDGITYYVLYLVNKQAELTGGVIVDAQANISQQTTAPVVNMQMNSEGAREWARITGANVNKRCAVVLDGFVYTAPNINEKIPSGSSQISGMDDLEEAKLIEIVLKAGALPAPVDIIEERTVGPSLGQDSINQGFNSTIIAFIIIAFFMFIYYKKSGAFADLALLFTILFIMGILAAFNATLTLPGIAGIILTIGMAVDANVLIFERIREELTTGKTVKAAVQGGFSHSYSAIFDSNITSFFTAVILYQFGSGPIQGFALTLMIGILSSLFCALVITKLLFEFMIAKGYAINIGSRSRIFDKLNYNFLGKRKIGYILSGSLLAIAIISFLIRGVELGIDFKGGSEIAVQFAKPIEITDVRQELSSIGLGNVEVKTFGDDSGVLVRTELQEIPKNLVPNVISTLDKSINKYFPGVQKTIVDSSLNSFTFEFPSVEITNSLIEKLFVDGFQTSRATDDIENRRMTVNLTIADWIKENLIQLHSDNPFQVLKEEKVGPKVGEELKFDAIVAVILSLIVILIYLGFRFKFGFALGAVIALFHDVLITLGAFSLLYGLIPGLNLEISVSVVAAFLTLVGYSINDTVVVFDRIREDIKIHKTANIEEIMNKAINKTLSRTVITSLTTLFAVIVILIFAGEVLRGFAFSLFFGIIIGTYSSIFVASAFVLEYAKKRGQKIQF
ncbi:MAG: protein translocase subunit SecD [Ignavibacteriae bacterium]|nr:protein translocase subunit SecD [Ignavibacteriota bacterium]